MKIRSLRYLATFSVLFFCIIVTCLTLILSGAEIALDMLLENSLGESVEFEFNEENTVFSVDERFGSVRFEDGKSVLIVQATKRNLAKAEAWLGHALEVPEKPGIFQK